jgi:hypothetical protein
MGWSWLSWVTGGLAGALVTQLIQHFKGSRAYKKTAARKATLLAYAEKERQLARDTLTNWQTMGGNDSPNSFQRLSAMRTALEASVKAFRLAGEEVEALELEKEVRGWEHLHAAQASGADPQKESERAVLRQRAKNQEALHKHLLDKARSMGGANTKNRTHFMNTAADAARAAAEAYREAGDIVHALEWEQKARNTIP